MFVTAFFKPKTTFRSTEKYISLFEKLASTGIQIELFLDKELQEEGTYITSKYSNVHIFEYVTLEDYWNEENFELPIYRNPEKDTVEYLAIQLSKLKFLSKVSKSTKSRYLAWIDFGIFHIFNDYEKCAQQLRNIEKMEFTQDKIIIPGCWEAGDYSLDLISWRFCGGFMVGKKELFEPAYNRQQELVFLNLPKLSWEVNYWSKMEEYFQFYKADHNESIIII